MEIKFSKEMTERVVEEIFLHRAEITKVEDDKSPVNVYLGNAYYFSFRKKEFHILKSTSNSILSSSSVRLSLVHDALKYSIYPTDSLKYEALFIPGGASSSQDNALAQKIEQRILVIYDHIHSQKSKIQLNQILGDDFFKQK